MPKDTLRAAQSRNTENFLAPSPFLHAAPANLRSESRDGTSVASRGATYTEGSSTGQGDTDMKRVALISVGGLLGAAMLVLVPPFDALEVAQRRVDHVDIVFNAGHPSVAELHYHVILSYVSPQRAASLAK